MGENIEDGVVGGPEAEASADDHGAELRETAETLAEPISAEPDGSTAQWHAERLAKALDSVLALARIGAGEDASQEAAMSIAEAEEALFAVAGMPYQSEHAPSGIEDTPDSEFEESEDESPHPTTGDALLDACLEFSRHAMAARALAIAGLPKPAESAREALAEKVLAAAEAEAAVRKARAGDGVETDTESEEASEEASDTQGDGEEFPSEAGC